MAAIRYTFKVNERLKKEQHINTLFRTGKAYSVFPLRLIYIVADRPEGQPQVQVGFSVPKKKFKLSVHRHRVRRLMVEAWRLSKHELYSAIPPNKQLHLFIVHTHNELPEYEPIHTAVLKGIEKLKLAVIAPAQTQPDA